MKVVSFVLLLIAGVLCLSQQERTVLYHRTNVPPSSPWEYLKTAENDQLVTFSLALKQRNLDVLEKWFWDNSNPKSPNFATHKTRDEIMKLIAPSEDDQNKIMNWIVEASKETGVEVRIYNMKDHIEVTAPVSFVNHLFQTNVHIFVNKITNRIALKHLGTLSVPEDVASIIDLVNGITEFPPFKESKNLSLKKQFAPCLVPYNMKKLYNVDADLEINNNTGLLNGIYSQMESKKEGFGTEDLASYQQVNNLPENPINCITGDRADVYTQKDNDGEAILDVSMVSGMAPGINICFYVMDNWMLEYATYVFNNPNPPNVISISYGWDENKQCDRGLGNCTDPEIPNSKVYVNRTNIEFQKLGLMGISVFVSSGDSGAVGSTKTCKISPEFPGCSPYITSVGGTAITDGGNKTLTFDDPLPPVCTDINANEQPALVDNAGYDTGGGFSNESPMPDYQRNAVQAYLNSGVALPKKGWNKEGRGFPDVAGIGSGVCIMHKGLLGYACRLIGGTSASAPLWAGLAALLNQDRINAGKTPLGFMNQILYDMFDESSTKYFNNDFPEGNNNGGCGDTEVGFTAMAGYWTPLTGLGSPKFDMIREYIANLP